MVNICIISNMLEKAIFEKDVFTDSCLVSSMFWSLCGFITLSFCFEREIKYRRVILFSIWAVIGDEGCAQREWCFAALELHSFLHGPYRGYYSFVFVHLYPILAFILSSILNSCYYIIVRLVEDMVLMFLGQLRSLICVFSCWTVTHWLLKIQDMVDSCIVGLMFVF